MSYQKLKKTQKLILILPFALIAAIIIVAVLMVWSFDAINNGQQRNEILRTEMNSLGQELKDYKMQHGKYPEKLSVINSSESLCADYKGLKCSKVQYKPSSDLQSFKMATKSFTSRIFFYDSGVSLAGEAISKNALIIGGDGGKLIIYRESKQFFQNPRDWPVL